MPAVTLWNVLLKRNVDLVLCEDNESAARVIETGRNPSMRHILRTHKVDLAFLHERFAGGDMMIEITPLNGNRRISSPRPLTPIRGDPLARSFVLPLCPTPTRRSLASTSHLASTPLTLGPIGPTRKPFRGQTAQGTTSYNGQLRLAQPLKPTSHTGPWADAC